MQRFSIILLLLGLIACGPEPETSQSSATPRFYVPQLSAELAGFINRLDQGVPRWLEGYAIPGAAIALVADGELVWSSGYGWADVKNRYPVTPDTVFAVEDLSKPVTAWGVMRLVEEGRMALDAPIEDYTGTWRLPPSEYDHSQVTIGALLSHTAGISPASFNPRAESLKSSLEAGPPFGRPALVDHPPGMFVYSDHGYSLLQLAIEEVTGQRFVDVIRDAVLRPLGMEVADYEVGWDIVQGAARGHGQGEGQSRRRLHYSLPEAAIGLNSTAPDLGRFLAAHMDGGSSSNPGRGVISPAAIRLMTTPVVRMLDAPEIPGPPLPFPETIGGEIQYSLGFRLDRLESKVNLLSHFSQFIGWTALVAAIPENGLGLVVLTNGDATLQAFNQHVLCEWLSWSGNGTGRSCGVLYNIYTVAADGTNVRKFSADSNVTIELSPKWSPVGSQLLFHRGPSLSHKPALFIGLEQGREARKLSHASGEEGPGAWSPRGDRVVFGMDRNGEPDIFSLSTDGSDRQQVTRGPGLDLLPAWSPDGRQVAFLRASPGSPGPPLAIWIHNLDDGTEMPLMPVEQSPSDETGLSSIDWSPDGNQIVYASLGDIYIVDIRDRRTTNLTNDKNGNRDPAWSRDGTRIAFASGHLGQRDIYVMNPDGSGKVLLIAHPGDDVMPSWSFDGRQIAFVTNREP